MLRSSCSVATGSVEAHGVHGISLLLVVLTTVLVPVALGASMGVDHRVRLFVAMNLLLEAGLIGNLSSTF